MGYLGRLICRILILNWIQFFYRFRRIGAHNMPETGGALMMPNHVSFVDAFIFYLASPRPIRYVVVDSYQQHPMTGWFLTLFKAIPIDREKPRDAIRKSIKALKEGDVVCLFPEGGLTRNGLLNDLKPGFALIAKKANVPIIPVYADGLWESIFSYERGRYIKKMPKRFFCPVQVAFGTPIAPEQATMENVYEGVYEASVEAVAARRGLETHLESAVIRALKKDRRRNFTYEYAKEPRRWSRAQFLGLALSIARRWIKAPPDSRERIGILLPPGPTPAAINLGLFLAGKTPVSLPFNLRADEVEKLAMKMEDLKIRTVITSKAFMPHLIDFWRGEEGRFIDIKTEMAAPGTLILSQESLFAKIEPSWLTNWRLEINNRPRNREAIGLIEDPDSEPIFLSSEELHRNVTQVLAADHLQDGDTILSEMSMNTVYGQLLQLWLPLLCNGRAISRSYSFREDDKLLRALATGQEANLLAGDLQFYKDIKQPIELPSLRCGLLCHELDKPDSESELDSAKLIEEDLQLPLTPCWRFAGRMVSMSLPPEQGQPEGTIDSMTRKDGSVGRLLPGIGARRSADGTFSLRFDSPRISQPSQRSKNAVPPAISEEDWVKVGVGPYIDEQGFLFLEPAEENQS